MSPEATLIGAGDIASCSYNRDYQTARVVNNTIATASAPVTIFTLGDNAYPDGTASQFRNCYDPTWGGSHLGQRTDISPTLYNPQMWDLTRLPVVGNHEYRTPGASAYFDYFGTGAGDRTKGYYNYDMGSWHFIVLTSNCDQVGAAASCLRRAGGSGQISQTIRPRARWLPSTTRSTRLRPPIRPS